MTKTQPPAKIPLGKRGEQIAAQYLKTKGYKLVASNWRFSRCGEIDIIAQQPEQSLLAFIEVKTRKTLQYGTPFEAITPTKQQQILRLAQRFLQQYPQWENIQVRFDALSVCFDASGLAHIEHLENAFSGE